MKRNIKSTKVSIKFANTQKRHNLCAFVDAYREACQKCVDELWAWSVEDLPKLPPKAMVDMVDGWALPLDSSSALPPPPYDMRVCIVKQAIGIVKGAKEKHRRRLWVMRKLMHEGEACQKLQSRVDTSPPSKPDLKHAPPELSSKTCEIDLGGDTSFDGWVTIKALGRPRVTIPFKKTKHWRKLEKKGKLLSGISLSKRTVTFRFEVPEPEPVAKADSKADTLGLDLGILDLYALSDGTLAPADCHGWTMGKIVDRLCKRKKGSHGFARTERHRTNYVNWALKQINLDGVSRVKMERLKHVRRGRSCSRQHSHFTYGQIIPRARSFFEERGVHVSLVAPQGTSQRCSECGWTCKANRRGKLFLCRQCGHTDDADVNAAHNLELDLVAVPLEQFRQSNKQGFFWFVSSLPGCCVEEQEPKVPAVLKS